MLSDDHSSPALYSASAAERPLRNSRFIWAKGLEPGRNQFVSFELRFARDQDAGSTHALIHLFADTRFRLWVNEEFVAYGPGRFVTQFPEFDSYEIGSRLKPGDNLVRVEVNYYGTSAYQTMPDGLPGFIAAGGTQDGAASFATPGDWRALVHEAWNADAPAFSFAQNPAEICDTRTLERELRQGADRDVAEKPSDACPWPEPAPRSVAYPDYRPLPPSALLISGPVKETEQLYGIQAHDPKFLERKNAAEGRPEALSQPFCTWIHSPRDQEVTLSCFWSTLQCNGQALEPQFDSKHGNHGYAKTSLKSGWNFLAGHFEVLTMYWSFLFGTPRDAGLTLHAVPDQSCEKRFAIGPLTQQKAVPNLSQDPETFELPHDWQMDDGDPFSVTPARLVAWDDVDPAQAVQAKTFEKFDDHQTITARQALWSFTFGTEYYGQPELEVEAPAGSILDVAYDDWRRDDGCVNLYGSNPFTDAADRFILRGGRQKVQVLNPRGGVYLQVCLRVPHGSDAAELTLHDLRIRLRTTLRKEDRQGAFESGDEVLDWAWEKSQVTLEAATDEAYSDCPWRERGSYIGDSLVNLHLHQLHSPDLRVARRTFLNFGRAQREDGQLAGCAPSWLRPPLHDFTLIWILAVRDYWAATGDTDFLAETWPVIEGIWQSSSWKDDPETGLWDMRDRRIYVDWGSLKGENNTRGSAALNMFRIAAGRATAEIAAALQDNAAHENYRRQTNEIEERVLRHLWDEKEQRFLPHLDGRTPAVHGNVLALRFQVGGERLRQPLMHYLEPMVRGNLKRGLEGKGNNHSGYTEMYFLSYLLPALAEAGRPDLAELTIREHYGHLRSLALPTLPEFFGPAHKGGGSCCHSWAGAGGIYASRYILGLRSAQPGNPDHLRFAPIVHGYSQARGAYPHRHGLITVEWARNDRGEIQAQISAPDAVHVTAAPEVSIT